jgi:hypothetical protein
MVEVRGVGTLLVYTEIEGFRPSEKEDCPREGQEIKPAQGNGKLGTKSSTLPI